MSTSLPGRHVLSVTSTKTNSLLQADAATCHPWIRHPTIVRECCGLHRPEGHDLSWGGGCRQPHPDHLDSMGESTPREARCRYLRKKDPAPWAALRGPRGAVTQGVPIPVQKWGAPSQHPRRPDVSSREPAGSTRTRCQDRGARPDLTDARSGRRVSRTCRDPVPPGPGHPGLCCEPLVRSAGAGDGHSSKDAC